MVTLEQLVPKDHLLRKIEEHIDFSFIHDKVKHLYCVDNGRPAVDPTLLFKMLFIGYIFGMRSERQLVREIEVNVAYRWFLRLGLTDKVIDASTFSQNRRRRFEGSNIEQEIFDEVVEQALGRDMIGGQALYTDSTHLKANANKNKHSRQVVEQGPRDYLESLERAVTEDRAAHGKGPLKPKSSEPEEREIKSSTTDPDSGYLTREGKPQGFYYLDHRTVDGKYGLVTDSHVTPGNVHDSRPYLSRLDRQQEHFNLNPIVVGLDAGYQTAGICKGLEDRGIYGVIGYRRPTHRQGYLRKREFHYDAERDEYRCPAGQGLIYRTTDRNGYRHYASDATICEHCPMLEHCTQSRNHIKVVTRHVWADSVERIDQHRLTPQGKRYYARRKETVERSFADAKQLHGHRYARFRGLSRVRAQCLLAAACQNMKKMALVLARFWLRIWPQGAIQTPLSPCHRFLLRN